MNRRDVLGYSTASLAAATLPIPAWAAFPERPIKLIVPFSPGGATDVVGRLWAEKMKARFGTVVTENKGGGGGVIGATEVARSTPNGETLLFGNSSTQVIIPAIADHPPYDPVKDFQAIYIMAISPTCIVVHESVPVHSLKEFIDYARANPDKLSYG
jgi:tripartite-type tricarboxylate transporter receptor subunit TctC